MATLYIAEYETLPLVGSQGAQIAAEPATVNQTVAIGGSSTQSSAFNVKTRYVGLSADAIYSFAFGANPTATASNFRVAADQIIYFAVTGGHKVACITNT